MSLAKDASKDAANGRGGKDPSDKDPSGEGRGETSLERLCAEKNMRMTDQRRVIARVLSAATDHPTVEEVHLRAHAEDDRISLSTVYRTVRLFIDAGIVASHDFGDGKARLERVASQHHDHLINVKNGEVIEFRNEEIEKLQERVARDLGYRLVDHRLELYGVPLDGDKKKENK